MPKLKVTLSIGFPTATHEGVIKIDNEDWQSCSTDEERDELCYEAWKEWSQEYIDGGYTIIE